MNIILRLSLDLRQKLLNKNLEIKCVVFQEMVDASALNQETNYSTIEEPGNIPQLAASQNIDASKSTSSRGIDDAQYFKLENTRTAPIDDKLKFHNENSSEYFILNKTSQQTKNRATEVATEGTNPTGHRGGESDYDICQTTDKTYDFCERGAGKFNGKQTTDEIDDTYHHLQPQNDDYSHI